MEEIRSALYETGSSDDSDSSRDSDESEGSRLEHLQKMLMKLSRDNAQYEVRIFPLTLLQRIT